MSNVTEERRLQDYQEQTDRMRRIKMGGDPDPDRSYPDLTKQQQGQVLGNTADLQDVAQNNQSIADIAGEMSQKSEMFSAVTRMMGQLNEAMNANNYIVLTLTSELARLRRLNGEARRDVHKAQQRHMEHAYNKQFAGFSTRVVVFSTVATALLAMLIGGWLQGSVQTWLFYVSIVLYVLAFSIALSLMLNNFTKRRKLHWNQFYWNADTDAGKPEDADDKCEDDGDY